MWRYLLLTIVSLTFASAASAQTCSTSWANAVDGNWDEASKWTAGLPDASDDACVTVSGTYTVTIRPDYGDDVTVTSLTIGGASGTQTFVSGGAVILANMTIGANAVADFVLGTATAVTSGLTASGTVLVEGLMTVNYPGVRGIVAQQGTVEVASGGTLRASNGAKLGIRGQQDATFRIRGMLELSDGAKVEGRTEVLGGTVRAVSGEGSLYYGGGILRNATLDASAGADLQLRHNFDVEGTLGGSPAGGVYIDASTLTAEASGVTLNVTGTGLQFGRAGLGSSQFFTVLTGGPVLNTGRIVILSHGEVGTGISGTTLTNEGTYVTIGFTWMGEDSVLHNRPNGVIKIVDSRFYRLEQSGIVRVVNEGLIEREYTGTYERRIGFWSVTLESRPGSEIRVLGKTFDFSPGPNDDALPPGMTLTGDGWVRMQGLPIRSTFSPGTEAEPFGTLGPRVGDSFVLAPEAISILDLAPGGVSDMFKNETSNAGSITFGGTLRLRFQPGFTPAIGDSWTLAVNGTTQIDGAFSAIEAPGAPSNIMFTVDTSVPGTAVLRAVLSTSGENGPGLPVALTLEAPQPNPLRGRMQVRFGLREAGAASVRVLDALGREVAVLSSEEMAAGWHIAEWQASVASGVYVVEVRAGDQLRRQRLTVAR